MKTGKGNIFQSTAKHWSPLGHAKYPFSLYPYSDTFGFFQEIDLRKASWTTPHAFTEAWSPIQNVDSDGR